MQTGVRKPESGIPGYRSNDLPDSGPQPPPAPELFRAVRVRIPLALEPVRLYIT